MEKDAPMPSCDGRLVRVHLIPKHRIKRTAAFRSNEVEVNDSRAWVLGCGGVTGISGHHGMLDFSRRLRIPRLAIPAETEEFAEQIGLGWWLDRHYGIREDA